MATRALDVCDVQGALSLYNIQGFPYWGMRGVPPPGEIYIPPHQIFIPSPPKVNSFLSLPHLIKMFKLQPNKNVIFSYSHCSSCTIFVLISYSFDTQAMLLLILIDVQYSQNAVFSFEKRSNCQNHSSSGSYCPVKKSPQQYSLLLDTKSGKLLKFQVKKK